MLIQSFKEEQRLYNFTKDEKHTESILIYFEKLIKNKNNAVLKCLACFWISSVFVYIFLLHVSDRHMKYSIKPR